MTEEWIEHHGKGYPDLPMDTLVQVRFADGEERAAAPVEMYNACWRHCDPVNAADITHYRVVTK